MILQQIDQIIENGKEYLPYCDVCLDDISPMWHLELGGHCHGEGVNLCPSCYQKLNKLLSSAS